MVDQELLSPFSVGMVDNISGYLEAVKLAFRDKLGADHFDKLEGLPLIRLEVYDSEREVTLRPKEKLRDIWLIDVRFSEIDKIGGIRVLQRLLKDGEAHRSFLYSQYDEDEQRLLMLLYPPETADSSFRFVRKIDPDRFEFTPLVCSDIEAIRGQWIDECRVDLNGIDWTDLNQVIHVHQDRYMTLAQLFADVVIRSPAGSDLAANIAAAYSDSNILLRYYRAFVSDPSAVDMPWNKDREFIRSLVSAIMHSRGVLGEGVKIPNVYSGDSKDVIHQKAESVARAIVADVRRFSLKSKTIQIIEDSLREKLPQWQNYPEYRRGWAWDAKEWKRIKGELRLDLLRFFAYELGGAQCEGDILVNCPKSDADLGTWKRYAESYNMYETYFCEPFGFKNGWQCLMNTLEKEKGQSARVRLENRWNEPIPGRSVLTITATLDRVQLEQPSDLHRSRSHNGEGTHFKEVLAELQGNGRLYIRSGSTNWTGWWNPYRGQQGDYWPAWQSAHLALPPEGSTQFVLEMIAPAPNR